MMRNIRFITEVPKSQDNKYGPEFRIFLQTLEASLTYHHDDYEIESVVRKDNTSLGKLVTLAHKYFFRSLYVDRNELQYLIELVSEPRVILASGPMGSGKTTIAHKLQSALRQRDDTFVHYINLKKVITQTKIRGNDGKPVCQYIYEDILLHRSLFLNNETKDQYRIFRVKEHEGFRPLALKIKLMIRGNEDQDWLDVLNSDNDLRQQENKLDSKTSEDLLLAHENLRVILDFLCKKSKCKNVILILDNIDRYKLLVQREVVLTAIDVRGESSVVITIRTRNLADLERISSDGRDDLGSDILRHEQLGVDYTDVITGSDILKHFIHKRTDFLNKHADDLGLTELSKERLNNFIILLNKVTGFKECSVLAALDMWYNHSLRHTGSNLASFIGRLLSEADPAHSFEKICLGDNCDENFDIHKLRNALFKYLVCGESLIYEDPINAKRSSVMFNKILNIYSSNFSNKLLPFPEFALLIFLHQRAGRVAFMDIVSSFGLLGLKPDEIAEIINQLRSPQGKDGFGLLIVEAPPGEHWQKNKNMAQIELLSTGKYFINTFCFSCEYTFWMALDTNVKNSFFKYPLKGKIEYTETEDDSLRALICIRFIDDHLLKLIDDAECYLASDSSIKEVYRKMFPDNFAHLPDLVTSIKRFIDNTAEPSDYKETANKELNKLQKKLR